MAGQHDDDDDDKTLVMLSVTLITHRSTTVYIKCTAFTHFIA